MLVSEREELGRRIVEICRRHGGGRSGLLPILQELQVAEGCISAFAMQEVARELDIHPVEVHSVVSFYAFLSAEQTGRFVLRLCRTVSCDMRDKERVARQLEQELGVEFGQTTPDGRFTLEWTHCLGLCDQGPALMVNRQLFTQVTPQRVHEILEACRRLYALYPERSEDTALAAAGALQTDVGGDATWPDEALRKAVGMRRVEIISQVRESGLRGRGGAGFPTGSKWNFAALAQDPVKVVVCNADEGEPGTFKDRLLLTDQADQVLEGMTIAARAIGAREGFIYLRGEYEYLRRHLEAVIRRREEAGLLGEDILGAAGFTFRVGIRLGAGAYVCGEETALIESLEGHRGEPRNRPPYPVNTGYLGHPTCVNNVETLVLAARVIAKGAEAFRSVGTASGTGSKLFSVSGDCARPGVYELPLGLTIEELLRQVGGEAAKAVQVGGASGVCVPRQDFTRRLAFDDASTGGSIIVFGPRRDMLRVARNFMEFFDEESCGQCTPCRRGNRVLLEGIESLEQGACSMTRLRELEALGESMRLASKCGLGQSSPNAFLSIVEHFKDEVLARPPARERESR